jgi:hypothetical protein
VKRCVLTLAAEDFDASAPPLLRGRALCCAACYSAGTPAASLEPLLRGLLAALQPTEPLHLRLCAARALNGLCGRAPHASVAPAAEALARIQVCGFPFQYGQGPAWRRALFLLGFACRLGLSKLSAAIFAPPVAFQVLNGDDYVAVWRRAQKTTRLLQLTALALVAAALGRSALRELFCVWLLFPG